MEGDAGTLKKSLIDNPKDIQPLAVTQPAIPPPKRKVKLYNTSVLVVAYVVFAVAAVHGILICAIWPLCNRLGGDKIQLGFVIAVQQFGKMAMAHPMSVLTEKYRHKHSLFVGCLLLFVGSLLFAFCPYMGGIVMLYLAMIVLGCASAAQGVGRAFVSEQTRPDRRTYVLGRLHALEYAGHYVLAIVSASLIGLGGAMSRFMEFALPAMLIALIAALAMYLIYYYMEDIKPEDELTEADFNPLAKVKQHKQKSATNGQKDVVDVEEAQPPHPAYAPPSSPMVSDAPHPPPNAVASTASSNDSSTLDSVEQVLREEEHQRVFNLICALNFVTRCFMMVYVALSGEIVLNTYDRTFYELGALITGAGLIGSAQMLGFKELWTNHFTDAMLFLLGFCIVGFGQVFAVNWTPGFVPQLWSYSLAMYSVLGVGGPIAICVGVGTFSVMQRTGHQSAIQAKLVFLEGCAGIVAPAVAGILEQCVRKFSTFSVLMAMLGISIIWVMQRYDLLMKYTDRARIGVLKPGATRVAPLLVLDNVYVRQFFTVMAGFLFLAGVVTFLISVFGERV